MSIKLMSVIWETGPEKQAERFVLLALADFCNDSGECWPSISSIAKKTCLSDRGVRQILRALEEQGWLETQMGGGRGGSNMYRLNPERGSSPRNEVPPEQYAAPRNGTTETRNGTTLNPERGSAKPSRTTKEPSVSAQEHEAMPYLRTVMSEQSAQAFIEHRKAKKAKLTIQAAKLIAGKLAGRKDADDIISTSIMNGWTGVFPDKQQEKSKQQGHDFWTGPKLN